FSYRADPIPLSHKQTEYRVVPDARRPLANEIFSIDRVATVAPDGSEREFRPFYAGRHASSQGTKAYWFATRRPAPIRADIVDRGTEVFLSLVDPNFSPA